MDAILTMELGKFQKVLEAELIYLQENGITGPRILSHLHYNGLLIAIMSATILIVDDGERVSELDLEKKADLKRLASKVAKGGYAGAEMPPLEDEVMDHRRPKRNPEAEYTIKAEHKEGSNGVASGSCTHTQENTYSMETIKKNISAANKTYDSWAPAGTYLNRIIDLAVFPHDTAGKCFPAQVCPECKERYIPKEEIVLDPSTLKKEERVPWAYDYSRNGEVPKNKPFDWAKQKLKKIGQVLARFMATIYHERRLVIHEVSS